MIKYSFLLCLLLAGRAMGAQKTIQGTFLDMDYQFAMSDEYQDVKGTWGEAKYSLEWDDNSKILEGSTAIEREDFEYNVFSGIAYLTIRCGYGQLELIRGAAYKVQGIICQQPVAESFSTEKEALEFIIKRSVVELVTEFPEPAKQEVADFLIKTMVLQ